MAAGCGQRGRRFVGTALGVPDETASIPNPPIKSDEELMIARHTLSLLARAT